MENVTNVLDLLNECIEQKNFNTLRLLCIIYLHEYKHDKTFMKIFNSTKINTQDSTTKKILLKCNWCSSSELCNLWNKMSKGNYTWENIEIVSEEPADYYCIINKPSDDYEIDKSKTILFRMEPYMEKHQEKWGTEWFNPNKDEFILCGTHETCINNVEWHLSKTYSELSNEDIIKNDNICNILSTVLSDKYTDIGQQRRVDFVKFLEKKGLDVDVYGGNRFLWKNYKGSLPAYKKDDALFPYKYTFNCENHSIKNYCTEKLYDGILAECLVFYSGCYNIRDTLDNRAFVYLELSNFEKDYNLIKQAIEEDWWSIRLPFIKMAKKQILEELQFFPRIKTIIDTL